MALSKFLQNVPKKFEILPAPSYKIQKKKNQLHITMETKETKTDNQEVVIAGDQKWEMVESTIGIIFLFEIHIDYFLDIQGIFKSHLKKITSPKKPIPTENPSLI